VCARLTLFRSPLSPLAPAVVDPGEETRNEIEEDEFRFFESRCEAFSDTVMIEQIDLVRN
jgi:hypothetical protein